MCVAASRSPHALAFTFRVLIISIDPLACSQDLQETLTQFKQKSQINRMFGVEDTETQTSFLSSFYASN